MSSTATPLDVPRQRADWMTQTDEAILETIRDEGNMTPQALDDTFDIAAANYARDRLSELTRYGLVEKIGRGLYRLTDDGRAFLNEELDASELAPVEDAD
ncbi:PhiH1 repressor-like [Haloarcula marismortui ATCC 43049]|jgi:Mn-dependent DtxR family transcriptional regulator|uniref:PhiH1 repressor-like n=2 Tax=Haloarcula marismortui (strain ATCC 43049 / DSM 3752 / JCM 8966 / VKM B-1809) TaxID=272569 RepID=Q5UZV5_HALMA|nr:PhiH1 repressor-like [Haloarcula marismortui ATCC 43049]